MFTTLLFAVSLGCALVAYLAATGLAIASVVRPDRFPTATARWTALVGFGLQTLALVTHYARAETHLFASLPEILLLASWSAALGWASQLSLRGLRRR